MRKQRKRLDAVAQQRQAYFFRESRAHTVSEEFPNVKQVHIHVKFQAPSWGSSPEPAEWSYSPSSKAFFEMECPHRECVIGGFDFSSTIRTSVKSKLSSATGEILCQGWQDRERIYKHKCLLKAQYIICVDYDVAASQGAAK